MATHSSIVAWRTPWTEKPGGLQSIIAEWCTTKACIGTLPFNPARRKHYSLSTLS